MRPQFWIRMVLILATMGGLTFWLVQPWSVAPAILAALALVFQTALLLHHVERPQRDMLRFFQAIEFSDFAQTFSTPRGDRTLEQLRSAFDRVIQLFHKSRVEQEAQFRYFQTVIQHVGIGIMVVAQDGRIDLINQRAKRLLGVRRLTQIDQLKSLHPKFAAAIVDLGPDEGAQVQIQDPESGDQVAFSLRAVKFVLHNESLTLISFQNIQNELESKESDAWQNLIRVLTHEIMNSVTPIASLAGTANRILGTVDGQIRGDMAAAESLKDVKEAVRTIESRSHGLLRFVDSYRSLTRIPKPEFRIVSIRELFENVANLMSTTLQKKGVMFSQRVDPETLEITADAGLIEQVLINLVQNAIDWSVANPSAEVALRASLSSASRPIIQVSDNGPGIEQEALGKIFIPFFTTKQEGSGIGLSISRQIMRLHGGSISVQSTPGKETVFTLRF